MTTTKIWRVKGEQFEDDSGNPLASGTLSYFDATTSNTQTVWKDATASTAWTPPITLASNGRLTDSIYVSTTAFKEVLKSSAGATVYSEDSIPGAVAVTTTTYALPATPVLTKAANYNLTTSDLGKLIETDTTGGDFTLTLPSAITASAAVSGGHYWIQQVGTAGKLTLATAGGQTINGVSSLSLTRPFSSWIVITDGANWAALSSDFPYATLSKTTTYTVTAADRGKLVKCDTSGGAWTLNLPSASSAGDGFEFAAIKTTSDASAVTLDGNASETVNGATTEALSLLAQWDAIRLRCDGSNWQIIGGFKLYGLKVGIAANNLLALNSAGQFPAMPMGPVPAPQGRLTLTTVTPVIASDVTAGTSVFYTPYVGQICPIYDGTNWQMWTFGEQTLTLNAAAHAINTVYDVIAFNNAGTFTIGTMPAWTTAGNFVSAGVLTTGTAARASALSRVQGLMVNTGALSGTVKNGASSYTVAASQGTYLGTIWIDATAGQLSCHVSYGQNRKWGVWNAYNRVPIVLIGGDPTASWPRASATIRAANGATANSLTTLCGLAEEWIDTKFEQLTDHAENGTNFNWSSGIGRASITAYSGRVGTLITTVASVNSIGGIAISSLQVPPVIGLEAFSALEKGIASGTTTFYGTNANMELRAVWRG